MLPLQQHHDHDSLYYCCIVPINNSNNSSNKGIDIKKDRTIPISRVVVGQQKQKIIRSSSSSALFPPILGLLLLGILVLISITITTTTTTSASFLLVTASPTAVAVPPPFHHHQHQKQQQQQQQSYSPFGRYYRQRQIQPQQEQQQEQVPSNNNNNKNDGIQKNTNRNNLISPVTATTAAVTITATRPGSASLARNNYLWGRTNRSSPIKNTNNQSFQQQYQQQHVVSLTRRKKSSTTINPILSSIVSSIVQLNTVWYTKVPSLIRYGISGNLGNVGVYICEQFIYNLLGGYIHDGHPEKLQGVLLLPPHLTPHLDTISFFIGYLMAVPIQHLLHAVLVYGLTTINTVEKYITTLVGMYSAMITACTGSTLLNAALLKYTSLSKSMAFTLTMFIFAFFNYYVISWIIGNSSSSSSASSRASTSTEQPMIVDDDDDDTDYIDF